MNPAATDSDITAVLSPWLAPQRWFGGKGHALTAVEVLARSDLGPVGQAERELLHLVVGVQLDGSDWQVYQVPLLLCGDPEAGLASRLVGQLPTGTWVYDALGDQLAPAALLQPVAKHPQVDPAVTFAEGGEGDLDRRPQLQAVWDPSEYLRQPARALSVEQSNTSIMFGSAALMKVFRRLIPGVNPDVEVSAALGSVGCEDIAQIKGWVNGAWRDPESGGLLTGHLAMIQQLLVPSVDGWDLSRERVAAGEDFAADSYRLGLATGSVHREMAQVLPTHELSGAEVAAMADRLHERLDRAAALVPELQELAPALHAQIAALLAWDKPIPVQRVHGDYHLGQVLLAEDGWKLLDFEGEPGGAIADRVVPDHALRDVAAMLRSYDYAAHMGGAGRDPQEVALWQQACQEEFLRGYTDSGAGDPRADAVILSAYEVDKAAYEAVYEKRNRPDWLPIPMAALSRLAGRSS